MHGEDTKQSENWHIESQNAPAQSTGLLKASKSVHVVNGKGDKAAKDIIRRITKPITEIVNDNGWCSTSMALNVLIVLAILIIAIIVYIIFFHNTVTKNSKTVTFA